MAYPHRAYEKLADGLKPAAVFLMWALDIELTCAAEFVAEHQAQAMIALDALEVHHGYTTTEAKATYGELLMDAYQQALDEGRSNEEADAQMRHRLKPHNAVVSFMNACADAVF